MKLNKLKWLRLLSPAVIIYSFMALVGYLTRLWELPLPENPEEWAKTIPALILSILYYISGLRNWANRYWFKKVNENIRVRLVTISGMEDDPMKFSWKALKPVFYYLVDNDKSLTKKSELAYFNGWLWTTVADFRALSAIFTAISTVLMFGFGIAGTQVAIFVFLFFFAVSLLGSYILTKFHKEIGNEQIEIIELNHKEDLSNKLETIATKSGTTSD